MRKEEAVAEERLAALRVETGEEEGGAGERGERSERMGKVRGGGGLVVWSCCCVRVAGW